MTVSVLRESVSEDTGSVTAALSAASDTLTIHFPAARAAGPVRVAATFGSGSTKQCDVQVAVADPPNPTASDWVNAVARLTADGSVRLDGPARWVRVKRPSTSNAAVRVSIAGAGEPALAHSDHTALARVASTQSVEVPLHASRAYRTSEWWTGGGDPRTWHVAVTSADATKVTAEYIANYEGSPAIILTRLAAGSVVVTAVASDQAGNAGSVAITVN